VQRKESEYEALASGMAAEMQTWEREEIRVTARQITTTESKEWTGENWQIYQGDAVDVLATLPEASVDLSVYSPPFLSLYTYTASDRDLGNCTSREEFIEHLGYIVRPLLRVTKPGRLTCCHLAQVTSTKATHGLIGLIDIRGPVIEAFVRAGWTYHGDITIDKNPQAQAIRTHSKALLFVQLKKDASWLRPALADYMLVFRAPGENAVPIHPDITHEDWIEWASPIWRGIQESDTLQARRAKGEDDERHLCPLQLPVIERCIRLWSNPGELVLSPFAGIGSEGYEAIRLGRRFLGVELKSSYAAVAVDNLARAEADLLTPRLL
jgi:DNA modification methylase